MDDLERISQLARQHVVEMLKICEKNPSDEIVLALNAAQWISGNLDQFISRIKEDGR